MSSLNKVILIGRIGQDVESFGEGKVAKTSLATSEKYTNQKGEKVEETEWHNLVFFGKTAEIAEKYVKKGDQISVEGKIKTQKWQDKDGNNRYTTQIMVNQLIMLGGNSSSSTTSDDRVEYTTQSDSQDESDLPF